MLIRSMISSLAMAGAAAVASPAAAAFVDWELHDAVGTNLGGFRLEFSGPTVTNLYIHGEVERYSIVSTFIFLDTSDHIAGETVHDFLLFFSPVSGSLFHEDYGGGEYYEQRVNEAAVRIGTLSAPLSPLGGTFDVVIDETFNYDESYVYCSYYEEIYDPDSGDYIGQGPCQAYYAENYYNIEAGYHHYGTLVGTVVATPLPAAAGLLAVGVGLLAAGGAARRRAA
ncbi:hypothetical protein P2H44_13465 [Albimonas sp. CAU 1670]|uniref:hypothetical protein n=1 Tax=Albimonas sp. CAU 1670 TaxID=3032599 RepID=UPI0023DB50CE|nr:hypothetical protein [Albimonas sp. CAU 1670]MDF2233562.1 hypothetical protein [Albimonas sp. CAU 1670]